MKNEKKKKKEKKKKIIIIIINDNNNGLCQHQQTPSLWGALLVGISVDWGGGMPGCLYRRQRCVIVFYVFYTLSGTGLRVKDFGVFFFLLKQNLIN